MNGFFTGGFFHQKLTGVKLCIEKGRKEGGKAENKYRVFHGMAKKGLC